MQLRDYILLKKGFFNRRVYEQRVMRRVVATIITPWLKESPSFFNLWPLPGDDNLKAQRRNYVDEEAMKTLKMHSEGGFEYVLENGRIIQKKINLN